MRRRLLILFLLVGVGVLLYRHFQSPKGPQDEIVLSGTVEVTEVDISPEIGGRVVAIHHREGERVKEGELLVELDPEDLMVRLREAEAALGAVEAEISLTRAKMQKAKRDLDRHLPLYRKKAISASRFDAVKTAYEVAKEAHAAALAKYEEVRAKIEVIKVKLQKTKLFSPIEGLILERNVEVGEVVSPGMAILTVGDLSRPWVRVYIGERDLGKVRLGQRVWVVTDAYPEKRFPGTLGYIAHEAEFTPKNIQTPEERVKLVYEGKVYLSNPEGILKPGMPVDCYLSLAK